MGTARARLGAVRARLDRVGGKSLTEDRYFSHHFEINHVEMVILIFFYRFPKSLPTFKPIGELVAHFNTNRVIGRYINDIYYI